MATKQPARQKAAETQDNEQLSESYISIGLGLLVVVVVGILLYNYFTQRGNQEEPITSENITEEATMSARAGGTYTVTEGDTLWSISEEAYGTGYNWSDIAQANELGENDQLVAGQELTIPEVTPIALASTAPEASPEEAMMEEVAPTPEPTASPELAMAPSPSPEVMMEASPAPETVAEQPAQIAGESYTVVQGDSLWEIAERAYGDPYKWVEIAQANDLINPDVIHPGNVMTLPR